MAPVSRENAECLTAALDECLPPEGKEQVRFVSTDDPSATLFHSLKTIFPNLVALCLDSTHLAMVYEYATWCGSYSCIGSDGNAAIG
jgi:hypothetical protein